MTLAAKGRGRTNAVFAAVANPERRKMLDALRSGERSAGELASLLPSLPQPAVSRHLRVLREAGLVVSSPMAQRRVYSISPEGMRDLDAWVSQYRGFWAGKIDALEAHLDRALEGDPRRPHQ